MCGSNTYVSPDATTAWKIFQMASASAWFAGRIMVGCMSRLTLALSGRPQRLQARGQRRIIDEPAARRLGRDHRPLEHVVRPLPPQMQLDFGHIHPSNILMLCVGPRPRSGFA